MASGEQFCPRGHALRLTVKVRDPDGLRCQCVQCGRFYDRMPLQIARAEAVRENQQHARRTGILRRGNTRCSKH